MATGQPDIPSALILALSSSPTTGGEAGEPGTPSTFSANLASSQYLLSRENSPSLYLNRDSSLSIHHRMSATPKAETMALPPSPPLTLQRIPSPEQNDERLDQQQEDPHTPRKHRFSGISNTHIAGEMEGDSIIFGRTRHSSDRDRQSPIYANRDSIQSTIASDRERAFEDSENSTPNLKSEPRTPIFSQGTGATTATETPALFNIPHNNNNANEGRRSSAKRLTPTFREEDIAALDEEKEKRRSGRSSRRFSRDGPRTSLSTPIGEDEEADPQHTSRIGRRSSGSMHRLEFKTTEDAGSVNTPYPGYGSSVGHSDFGKKSWSQHHPHIPRSSYYVGPPPVGSAFGTNPMGEIGVHYPREIVRVERDYSAGELVQFYPTYPLEFEGRVNPTQFQETINQINEVMISAHSLRASAWEHVLGVATLYLSLLVFESHYSKEMRRLADLIGHFNATIYNPAGLNILWPRKSAFMFLEIEYY